MLGHVCIELAGDCQTKEGGCGVRSPLFLVLPECHNHASLPLRKSMQCPCRRLTSTGSWPMKRSSAPPPPPDQRSGSSIGSLRETGESWRSRPTARMADRNSNPELRGKRGARPMKATVFTHASCGNAAGFRSECLKRDWSRREPTRLSG